MALHLRAIHTAHGPLKDSEVIRRLRDDASDQLRDELEKVRPFMRWPLKHRRTVEAA